MRIAIVGQKNDKICRSGANDRSSTQETQLYTKAFPIKVFFSDSTMYVLNYFCFQFNVHHRTMLPQSETQPVFHHKARFHLRKLLHSDKNGRHACR